MIKNIMQMFCIYQVSTLAPFYTVTFTYQKKIYANDSYDLYKNYKMKFKCSNLLV